MGDQNKNTDKKNIEPKNNSTSDFLKYFTEKAKDNKNIEKAKGDKNIEKANDIDTKDNSNLDYELNPDGSLNIVDKKPKTNTKYSIGPDGNLTIEEDGMEM
jgi:hypothetical protein